MINAAHVITELKKLADPAKAEIYLRFFKTGPGLYGEGDLFLGISVPVQRRAAKEFTGISIPEIEKLLESPYHECRLTALLIMIEKFSKGDGPIRDELIRLYLSRTDRINNWDLVDLSCYKMLGPYLENRNRKILYSLAKSSSLWEQRISIVTTYHFIKNRDFVDLMKISCMLLNHKHDLIHKAVGWMLREAGKRDISILRGFLDEHHANMPRTMLRYSIEKLDPGEKKKYMMR